MQQLCSVSKTEQKLWKLYLWFGFANLFSKPWWPGSNKSYVGRYSSGFLQQKKHETFIENIVLMCIGPNIIKKCWDDTMFSGFAKVLTGRMLKELNRFSLKSYKGKCKNDEGQDCNSLLNLHSWRMRLTSPTMKSTSQNCLLSRSLP